MDKVIAVYNIYQFFHYSIYLLKKLIRFISIRETTETDHKVKNDPTNIISTINRSEYMYIKPIPIVTTETHARPNLKSTTDKWKKIKQI